MNTKSWDSVIGHLINGSTRYSPQRLARHYVQEIPEAGARAAVTPLADQKP
jgi:hypothetical protein